MSIGDYESVRAAASGTGELDANQVLAALVLLRELRAELADWEPQLIAAARELGTSWADLAPALGVASRQAAERRYLRLRPSDLAGATGEQRVQAERDRRAGDRAVSSWAQDNAAALRTLAGSVGEVDAAVRAALSGDDAAQLLGPLADAQNRVRSSHPALADRIEAVNDQVDRVRRDTQSRRDEIG
ncbi:HSP18 transcriptional regulator [Lentzea sp. NBRC 102530]|uniref:HSP18 transcriptional regulator n=1 Tax=Lentzea sp. NBRC 102530 TaxID=3032201 RepID=UPI0024A526E2|nr:HSP18 transcriptional regulator [Lentzea sp. NBRC 102530]GLY50271.1 hypothetical protein Lesp01_39270 [Lentzea sp. NBRC 102530]